MSAPRRLLAAIAVLGLIGAAMAQDPPRPSQQQAQAERPPPSHAEVATGSDAGLSEEDKEVVQNLELLENLDQVKDMDLMVELSKDD